MPRTAIKEFTTANPLYRNAVVSFYTVAAGAKTATLATLYASGSGSSVLANPQKLNSRGRLKQPVYHDVAVIAVITGISEPTHETGVINTAPAFRVSSEGLLEYSYDGGVSWTVGGSYFLPLINPKNDGALGNDLADDYAELQESLDNAVDGDWWVLPTGNYRVSQTLKFRKGVRYVFNGKIKPYGAFADYLVDFGKGTTAESPGPEGPGNRLTRMDVHGLWLDCEDQARGIKTHRIDNSSFTKCRVDNVCGTALRSTVTRECAFHDLMVWYGADIDTLTAVGRNSEALIDLNDQLDVAAGFGDPNNKIDFFNLTTSYCGATTYLSIDTTAGTADVRDIRFFGGQIHYLDDFDVTNTVDYPRYGDSASRGDDAAVVLIDIQNCQRVSFYGTLVNYPGKSGVAIRIGTSATKLAQYVGFKDLFINNAYVGGNAIGFQVRYAADVTIEDCMPILWNGTGTEATYINNFISDPTGYLRKTTFGQIQVRRLIAGAGLFLDGSNASGTTSPSVYLLAPGGRSLNIRRNNANLMEIIGEYGSGTRTLNVDFDTSGGITIYPSGDLGLALGKSGNRMRALFMGGLSSLPADALNGMITWADRSTWDPLSRTAGEPYPVYYMNRWRALDGDRGVSADAGNAAASYDRNSIYRTLRYNTPITADRSVTLATSNFANGDKLRVVRTAASTGAFNVNVGTGPLKALAAGQWCDVEFDGSAWMLTAFGSL